SAGPIIATTANRRARQGSPYPARRLGPAGVSASCIVPGRFYLHLRNSSSCGEAVALNIKDTATEQAVRELASVTGESVTAAVRRAAEERLPRVRRARAPHSLAMDLLEIGRRCAALPDIDSRSVDEILGYDEHGLPS